jgi:hypothetical protein
MQYKYRPPPPVSADALAGAAVPRMSQSQMGSRSLGVWTDRRLRWLYAIDRVRHASSLRVSPFFEGACWHVPCVHLRSRTALTHCAHALRSTV